MNITTINLQNIQCHPKLDKLYLLSKDVDSEKIFSELTDEMLIFIQKNKPLHVIKNSNNQYYFFGNWDILVELKKRDIKKATAIIHKNITIDEIIDWAYRSEITKWIPYLKDRSQFKYLKALIELSPLIVKGTFKDGSNKMPVSYIKKIANLTRSQVRTKIDKKEKKVSQLEQYLGNLDE